VIEYAASFPSAITSERPENNTVPLVVLVPEEAQRPLPVVILMHYWGASDLKIERGLASEFTRRGIATVILTLPYHLARTPSGFRSGELSIQPDPQKLIANMVQSVSDARRTIDFIHSRPEFDPNRVGVAGTSLGSIVATLTYSLDNRISVGGFMLAGIDLAHILWHSSRVVREREALRRRGFTEGRLRSALQEVEPGNYLPREAPGRTYVIGGRFDTVIPPADTQKLIAALHEPQVLWLDTGHYGGVFVQKRVQQSMASFFQAEFKGEQFSAPKRIYAPTVRVGAPVNTINGLQLGAGIDIWRANARGDAFSTLMATPKGVQLFLGFRLDRGLAVGGFATTRGIAPGVFWSTVL
jgi:hypothetical protein